MIKSKFRFLTIIAIIALIGFGTTSCGETGDDPQYNLGDTGPGGGIIFYYNSAGFNMTDTGNKAFYLEVAPEDLGSLEWQTPSDDIAGTGTGIGTGRKNTALIHAFNGNTPAAKACAELNIGDRTDWFLPSVDELDALYQYWNDNGKPAKLNFIIDHYWSSTQDVTNVAFCHDFSGIPAGMTKNTPLNVRAIRAF